MSFIHYSDNKLLQMNYWTNTNAPHQPWVCLLTLLPIPSACVHLQEKITRFARRRWHLLMRNDKLQLLLLSGPPSPWQTLNDLWCRLLWDLEYYLYNSAMREGHGQSLTIPIRRLNIHVDQRGLDLYWPHVSSEANRFGWQLMLIIINWVKREWHRHFSPSMCVAILTSTVVG